eukprot:TRINITY_DN47909_c0_g1_i1.p1 TRINITY_DN47909_c0_g1~~TRINITY_DN47909_c0_g1_i1.p1  ORF type:complete len:314 (-),score=58.75 TRINITY_DN47909_c0_g1_i1:130-1020(-)
MGCNSSNVAVSDTKTAANSPRNAPAAAAPARSDASAEEAQEPPEADAFVRAISEKVEPRRFLSRSNSQGSAPNDMAIAPSRSADTTGSSLTASGSIHERECNVVGRRMSQGLAFGLLARLRKSADTGKTSRLGLEKRLHFFGMRSLHMKADGNCQFRSLAFNLFGSQHYHAYTRKAVVRHMLKHKEFFGAFFSDERRFQKYLQGMACDTTWGDELTLRAAVEVYACVLHLITSCADNWYLVYEPESFLSYPDMEVLKVPESACLPPAGKVIFLAYHAPDHYNAIIRSASSNAQALE